MILVTGATGLVGSHLIQALVSAGKPVKALYRKSIPQIVGAEQVQWVQADILDVVALEAAMEGITHVYHCAAIVSFSPKQKAALHQTNIEGTANVVNACLQAGVQKLLYVSSVAALGRIRESGMVDESMNWSE
ncbi:MAG TPA: 3-beta hydroxysteroid dehydrogenase, partial [Chitinophagaceae bacterium]|nr:3-beta hydroxysteroid dehydrogenase [Chitinophagaceae bacterium]